MHPILESLEPRLLAAIVSASITSGILVLRGDANPTNATITQDAQVRVKDWSNGFAFVCAGTAIHSVTWTGGDGTDRVDARGLQLPLVAWAKSGRDLVWGGVANDWLSAELAFGGAGRDHVAERWAINGDAAADVQQGQANNCAYMAALAGVSEHADLAGRIRYRGRYLYDVPLHSDGAWRYVRAAFNGSLTAADPVPVGEEFWTVLYARAFAAFRHGDVIAYPSTALAALTGRHITSYGPWGQKPLAYSYLAAELAQDHAVAIATWEKVQSPVLVGNHAYAVLGVQDGMVHLVNPWDGSRPFWVTWDVFKVDVWGCWTA